MKFVKYGFLTLIGFLLLAPLGVFFPALGAYNPASLVGVATVATLRAANYLPYPFIYLVGYTSFDDGGEGVLAYNSGSSAADNSCTVFRDASANVFQRLAIEGGLNVDQCGAVGSGTVDDTTAVQRALTASTHVICSAGKTYEIMGTLLPIANSVLDFSGCKLGVNETVSGNPMINISVSGVTVQNLHLIQVSSAGGNDGGAGIAVGQSASANNTTINNLFCDSASVPTEIAPCIYIYNGSNLVIDNLKTLSTGYGILQASNTAFTTVKVSTAIATDMYADFFEQASGSGGNMTDVVLDNITFNGSHDWPTPETEERFAGFTNAFRVTISNSHVQNAAGDACVHVENGGGQFIIANSTFRDCQVDNQDGWIYLLTSSASIILTGDWFIIDNAGSYTCSGCYAVGDGTADYSNPLTATGNSMIDLQGAHQIGGFDLGGYAGNANITGNSIIGGSTFVLLFSSGGTATDINISSNNIASGTNGVYSANAFSPSGNGGTNIDVRGNTFNVSGYAIVSGENSNATGAPVNWRVIGNTVLGAGTGVNIAEAINTYAGNNWYASGLTINTVVNSPGSNTIECLDFKQGTGIIHTSGC